MFSANLSNRIVVSINDKTSIKDFYRLVSSNWQEFDINAPGLHDWSVLQAACHYGNVPLAMVLIKMGARVNHPRTSVSNQTALYDAIKANHLEFLVYLAKRVK